MCQYSRLEITIDKSTIGGIKVDIKMFSKLHASGLYRYVDGDDGFIRFDFEVYKDYIVARDSFICNIFEFTKDDIEQYYDLYADEEDMMTLDVDKIYFVEAGVHSIKEDNANWSEFISECYLDLDSAFDDINHEFNRFIKSFKDFDKLDKEFDICCDNHDLDVLVRKKLEVSSVNVK